MKITIYTSGIALFLLLFSAKSHAQQDPGYTQYMYNPMSVNAGYTGSTGMLDAVLMHRSQWVGIDGAPSTQAFAIHSPLRNEQIGLGFSAANDKLGPSSEIYLDANFAYTLYLGYSTKLALGIKAGARVLNVDWTKGRYYDGTDVLLNSNINDEITPSIGAGAYLYDDRWYVGFSVPSFIRGDYYDDLQQSVNVERLHYYLMGGYVFDLTDDIKFKPAVLVRGVNGAPLTFDFSANFLIQEKFTIGAGYRHEDSVTALAGFQISKDFFLGYSYDYTTTDLNKYNDGSHEIVLRFQLSKKSNQIKSPRFY